VPYHTGWGILAAHGSRQVEGATIARLDAQWRPIAGSEQEIDCDAICIGYGFQPLTTLARLAGAAHEWRADLGGEVPIRDEKMETSVPGIFAAGDGAGIGGYRLALLEGQIAGSAAAALSVTGGVQNQETLRALGRARRLLKRERGFQKFYAHLFTPGPGLYERTPEETVACRCEGVTFGHLNEAIQNGARTLVELKALTRCGMGECQGRICGAVIPPWLARATGQSPAAVGSYPARPPAFPIPLSAFSNEEK
jgi:NAD(P)H-nitrite reductase large subunit